MADPERYQSALTGPEMDQALLDMANHTSERFAKGTANGVAVTSGQVGFQDNSKYYKDQAAAAANQAENAATRAESAVPAGTNSAVLFTQSQTLTEDQKQVARRNIRAGATNPNLLDNPFFLINQRDAVTVRTVRGFVADRWMLNDSNGTYTYTVNGIEISNSSSASTDLVQRLELPRVFGKRVMFAVKANDSYVGTAGADIPAKGSGTQTITSALTSWGGIYIVRAPNTAAYDLYVVVRVNAGKSILLQEAKLEYAGPSNPAFTTLQNDLPPNYAEDLARCQRYAVEMIPHKVNGSSVGLAVATGTGALRAYLYAPVFLRRTDATSVRWSDIKLADSVTGTQITPTNITLNANAWGNVLRLDIVASGITQGRVYQIITGDNPSLFISADF